MQVLFISATCIAPHKTLKICLYRGQFEYSLEIGHEIRKFVENTDAASEEPQ